MMISFSQIKNIKAWLGSGSINIFGPQFSGKDTQGRRLAKFFDAALIGGGDILRSQPEVPEHVRQTINTGKLAPKDDYLKLIPPYLNQPDLKGRSIILSSVGRWHGEEPTVLEAAVKSGHPLKAALFLKLDEREVWVRWRVAQQKKDRGQRADDTAEGLRTRLEEFQNKTLPVIEFYRNKGLLIEVNGNPAPDDVTSDILTKLLQMTN